MIEIRPYHPSDAPALWEVYYSAIRQTAAADYTPEQVAAWAPESFDEDLWADRLAGINPFVAEIANVIVGYADVQPNGYIDHFFVKGAFNRQGCGISTDAGHSGDSDSTTHPVTLLRRECDSPSLLRAVGVCGGDSAVVDREGGGVEELSDDPLA